MRRLIITTATGLFCACIAGGCAKQPQRPPAPLGSPAPSAGAPSSTTTDATSGSMANADLGSSQVTAAINAATTQATALHLTGTVTAVATPLTLDAHLNGDGTSTGTLGYQGATIPFRVFDGIDYFQLTPSLMTLAKVSRTSARGKWVTSTSSYGSSLVTIFSQFLTLKAFASSDLDGTDATFTFAGLDHIGAQHVVVYHERFTIGPSFTYDIAATGPALPLKIFGGDSNNGADVELTWNQPTTITAPPQSQIYTS